MTQNIRRRSGFTLVEMLVASALIIFMMYIIASAFEKGLESFRVLKIQGDLQDKLRAAATAIRLDLTAQHFGDGSALSDQRLNDQLWQPPTKGYFRISQPGVPQGQMGTGMPEGIDPDGGPGATYYRTTANTNGPVGTNINTDTIKDLYLQFTVNLTNGHPSVRDARARRDQFFMTKTDADSTLNPYSAPDYNSDGSNQFTSYWAEITYFAKPNGKFTDTVPGQTTPVPLFDLYRRQALLVEPPAPPPTPMHPTPYTYTPAVAANGNYDDVSVWTPQGALPIFNGSADVTEPVRRWGAAQPFAYGQPAAGSSTSSGNLPSVNPFPTIYDEAQNNLNNSNNNFGNKTNPYADPMLGSRVGGDLLLTNVVNFEIKVLWEPVVVGAANANRFVPPTFSNGTLVGPPDYIGPSPKLPSGVANPDYPFDYLPVGINQGIAPPNATNLPRVFDTWSSNTDTSSGTPYIYGVDRSIYPATGPLAGPQPGLATDPNYANWNIGHFTPMPGIPAANTQASTPTNYTIPLRVRVRAIQIKLRIWDQKTSQTRQMTIIQDM